MQELINETVCHHPLKMGCKLCNAFTFMLTNVLLRVELQYTFLIALKDKNNLCKLPPPSANGGTC